MTTRPAPHFAFLLLALALLAQPALAESPDAGTLTGAGSTFVNPLMSRWSKAYNALHPEIRINYQSIGSGGGRQQFLAKTVDFGASDAPLTDEQLTQAGGTEKVVEVPVTHGSVVLAYNLSDLLAQLRFSPETVAGIYLGTIKMWNAKALAADNPNVKLPAKPILLVHRSDGSGTTDIFTDYLSKVSDEWKTKVGHGTSVQWPAGVGGQGNEGVANQVRNTAGGIGYIELAYAKQNDIPYGLVKNKAGNYTDPAPGNVTNAAASLQDIPADLRFSITDQAGAHAYPIAGTVWVLLYKAQADAPVGKLVTRFVNWAIHDGQRYANELDYAALAPNLVQKADAALKSVTCGGRSCLAD